MKNNIGVHVPEILLPKEGTDMTKWSVVACDQFTSQPEYWHEVERLVSGSPSTLHLTLPEVYLEEKDADERIDRINAEMAKYLAENILVPGKPGFIYVDRKTSHVGSRKGLIISVDLEEYEYKKGAQSLIRATEGTVIERLPPRIRIRQNAPIELPHIMLLIDDENKTVIEPLADACEGFDKAYDFELMMSGGHLKGYKIEDEKTIGSIIKNLEKLASPEIFSSKYDVGPEYGVLLFAVGDGNHSLASAKAFWENLKSGLSDGEKLVHPARYALVEVVNVHDSGLEFEPIHRVVFDANTDDLLESMKTFFTAENCSISIKKFESVQAMQSDAAGCANDKKTHVLPFVTRDCAGYAAVSCPKFNLEVGTLQSFLDSFVKSSPKSRIDYIHGDDVVLSLGTLPGNVGFYLPAMDKCDLFKTVILDGALPRKTFSMGEADEKRYYLECRSITL